MEAERGDSDGVGVGGEGRGGFISITHVLEPPRPDDVMLRSSMLDMEEMWE